MKVKESIIISTGIVLAALVWGIFFFQSRAEDKTIKVVGSASKQFQTDIVKWQLRITRSASQSMLSDGYSQLRSNVAAIKAEILAAGIEEKHVTVQPVNTMPVHNREGVITSYRIQQSLTIISDKVDNVEKLALNPDTIVSKGIIVEQSQLSYFYSKVDELKRQLLGEASNDARMRADEIAGGTGVIVGSIKNARAGVFQITEPYSTEVSGYGIYNTSSREKEIKVTVHVEFKLD